MRSSAQAEEKRLAALRRRAERKARLRCGILECEQLARADVTVRSSLVSWLAGTVNV